jgi:hypothetical protein
MPSGSYSTRLRRKLRLRRHRLLKRINERRVKVGMHRVDTLTQAYREWKPMRSKEAEL